jgi:AAA+ ATPase superfamily predicted ATPase
MIIERSAEAERLRKAKKWVLLFGRRKTGKSFLAENFLKWDEYFFVKRDKGIISKKSGRELSYGAFLEVLEREMLGGKTLVVDEFHRLGADFLDRLHASGGKGRLVLISSTLFLSKKLVRENSPLLGLVAEQQVRLISLGDCLRALGKSKAGKKASVESALLLREPLAIGYSEPGIKAEAQFASVLAGSMRTMPALVGEIFLEEERELSAVYDGILRAVAAGKVVSTEITDAVFARGLIPKNDASQVQQYLKNLADFGILRRIAVFGKNKFIYKHVSPLVRLYYYADGKYNASERQPDEAEIGRIAAELIPRMVEDEVRALAAEKLGLSEAVMEGKDFDVDACLLRFRKPAVAMEIKWKVRITLEDVRSAERSLENAKAGEKWLFVPDRKMVLAKTSLKIVDIGDLIGDGS